MKVMLFLGAILYTIGMKAQPADSIICPKIEIEGPYENKAPVGTDAIFIVKRFKKNFEKTHRISYLWTVENGLIKEGADNRILYVDTKGKLDQQITVKLILNGLDKSCPNTKVVTIDVIQAPVKQRTVSTISTNPFPKAPKM